MTERRIIHAIAYTLVLMAPQDHARERDEQTTFDELQRIDPTKFHELGDELLPWICPELHGLKAHGRTLDGKPRKGTPDSYVGQLPATCRAAVEYTVQAEGIQGKLGADYEQVRKSCKRAENIVLCTNRCIESLDLSTIERDAETKGITLRLVDGCALTRALCKDRQDLRQRFLNIPIGQHTTISLIRRLAQYLDNRTNEPAIRRALERFIIRPQAERTVREAIHRQHEGLFIVIAPAGMGKTTWSVEHARRLAAVEPVFWSTVTGIEFKGIDPISIAIVHAAYGTADPGRVVELADLLRREHRVLRVVLDAVDESRDYEVFTRALGEFRTGKLGERSNVLLTCREGALESLKAAFGPSCPGLFETWRGNLEQRRTGAIWLEALDEEKAHTLLHKEGATAIQARTIVGALPIKYRGTPLFLVRALELAREGKLPTACEDDAGHWIRAFAEQFVEDISKRIKADGRAPSKAIIAQFAEQLAQRALLNPSATVSAEQLADVPGGDVEGENTILGRALQVGLLVRRGDGVAFSHARFLEHFAARALKRRPDPGAWMDQLQGDSGRAVLVELLSSLSEPELLLKRLLAKDSVAACKVASHVGRRVEDTRLREDILAVPRNLLRDRFPSERQRGLDLLKQFPWPEAAHVAAEWFNGLSQRDKRKWMSAAAEVVLTMQIAGAVGIVVNHRGFGFDWYEPGFVSRIEALPPEFRERCIRWARRTLEQPGQDNPRGRFVRFLAMFRDEWLIEYLRKRLDAGPLDQFEHRALIHLNTYESILLYAESVEIFAAQLEERATNVEERERQSLKASAWEAFRLRGADILMFPHDALIELVEATLEVTSARYALFAWHWAEFLGAERLLTSYYATKRRLRCGRMRPQRHGFMARIAERSSFGQMMDLYEKHADDDLRDDIVDCIELAPCADTEEFLIERLKEGRHQFSAIQSLADVGSLRAGPALLDVLKTADHRTDWLAAKALGRLRYTPAVPALINALEERDSYSAIASLGRIGGPLAYKALQQAFERTTLAERLNEPLLDEFRQQLLWALLYRREQEGIEIVKQLLARFPEAVAVVASAVGYWDVDDQPQGISQLGEPLDDDILRQHVLVSAEKAYESGIHTLLDHSLRGVACFDHPAAIGFLEDIAERASKDARTRHLGWDAKWLLALRGRRIYQELRIKEDLSHIVQRGIVTDHDISRLARWNHDVVRTVLLDQIVHDDHLAECIGLLRWFAKDEDLELFRRFEQHTDDGLADLAHVYLKHRDRFVRSA